MKIKTVIEQKNKTQSLYLRSFTWTGISLLLICLIGYIVASSLGGIGVFQDLSRLNFGIYETLTAVSIISFVGLILILISSGLSIYFYIRFLKVSRRFIYIAYTVYILAQGLGFSLLFLTLNAIDLLAIFGISGGLFALMALFGYFAKDLSGLWPFLLFGSIVSFILFFVNLMLWFLGIYSELFTMIIYGLIGFLTLLWIAFDVWRLKKTEEWAKNNYVDEETRFKISAFFGYRFLVDIISLIWVVARFLIFSRR